MTASTLGVDIAWQKPSGAQLAAAGVAVASLYVGQDTSGKNMNAAVVADYTSHGVGVITNFEYGAAQMANGAPQGTIDAKLGLSQKRAAGVPDSRPSIFSADWRATAAEITGGIIPYLVSARAVLGAGLVGVYGSYYVVKAVADYWAAHFPGEKIWLWQTVAWSDGLIDPRIDFYQNGKTITIGGIVCDWDEIRNVNSDVGQYPAPAPVDPPPAPATFKDLDMPQQIESLDVKADGQYMYSFSKGEYREVAFVADTFGAAAAQLRVVIWTAPKNPDIRAVSVPTGSNVIAFPDPANTYAVSVVRQDTTGKFPVGVNFV